MPRISLLEKETRANPFIIGFIGFLLGLPISYWICVKFRLFTWFIISPRTVEGWELLSSTISKLDAYYAATGSYPPGKVYSGDMNLGEPYNLSVLELPWAKDAVYHYLVNARLMITSLLAIVFFIFWCRKMRLAHANPATFIRGIILWFIGLPFAVFTYYNPTYSFRMMDIPLSLPLCTSIIGIAWWWYRHPQANQSTTNRLIAITMPFYLVLRISAVLLMYIIASIMIPLWTPSQYIQYATDGKTFYILQTTYKDCEYDINLETLINTDTENLKNHVIISLRNNKGLKEDMGLFSGYFFVGDDYLYVGPSDPENEADTEKPAGR